MGEVQKADSTGNLGWIDLEMTGLEPDHDEILEMAIIITDSSLDIVAESDSWVFACSEEKLSMMDSWNKNTHKGSGLLDKVQESSLDYVTGEREALAFLKQHLPEGESPMCGNTICQDRRFLARHMRRLHDYFHYRNFDVSSFKIACGIWLSSKPEMPAIDSEHRALNDIRHSIQEMRTIKKMLFKQ